LYRGHAPRGERALTSAFDVWVDIAVREVVDHTARGAHDDHAEREHDQHLLVRPARARDPECPQRRPQQQPCADRTVEARQARIFLEAAGQAVMEGCQSGLAGEDEVCGGGGAIHLRCIQCRKNRTTGRPWRQGTRPTHPAWALVEYARIEDTLSVLDEGTAPTPLAHIAPRSRPIWRRVPQYYPGIPRSAAPRLPALAAAGPHRASGPLPAAAPAPSGACRGARRRPAARDRGGQS